MNVVGVIPARYESTRFPGKPLKLIAGKPLLEWVIEGAKQSKLINKLVVATDDERISRLANRCGVECVMTDSKLPTGTDRVWAAVKNDPCDVVLNIQGDEPLVTGAVLDHLVKGMEPSCEMATLGRPFKDLDEIQNPNTAKIVVNKSSEALYFSRLPVPFSRIPAVEFGSYKSAHLKHVGLYAYTKVFLRQFCEEPPAVIEVTEGLEQLRALWLGARIKVIVTDYESWGVDTPEDVIRIEEIIRLKRSPG